MWQKVRQGLTGPDEKGFALLRTNCECGKASQRGLSWKSDVGERVSDSPVAAVGRSPGGREASL